MLGCSIFTKNRKHEKDWLRLILHHLQLKRLNQSLSDCQVNILSRSSTKKRYKPPPLLPINLSNLYSNLNNLKQKPVLLSALPNYCEQLSSNQTTKSYPKVLTELYDEKYRGLDYANLL